MCIVRVMDLPVALKSDTIAECVFEVRFAPGNPSVAELLPGIIFQRLNSWLSTSLQLPTAQIPAAMRAMDPNMRYQPTHALEGKGVRVVFGPQELAIAFARPYPGWSVVRPRILECVELVARTGLTGQPERCGLKYVNLLTGGRDAFDISQLKIRIELDGFTLSNSLGVHAEVQLQGCVSIIDVLSGATVTSNVQGHNVTNTGVVVSVDTQHAGPYRDFLKELPDVLDLVHNTEKQVYFSLLQKDTLEKLGPMYSSGVEK